MSAHMSATGIYTLRSSAKARAALGVYVFTECWRSSPGLWFCEGPARYSAALWHPRALSSTTESTEIHLHAGCSFEEFVEVYWSVLASQLLPSSHISFLPTKHCACSHTFSPLQCLSPALQYTNSVPMPKATFF